MKILRLLWEIVFPFDIVRTTPKQQALRTPDHAHLSPHMIEKLNASHTQNLIAVDALEVQESPSESQAGNALGKPVAA